MKDSKENNHLYFVNLELLVIKIEMIITLLLLAIEKASISLEISVNKRNKWND